MPKTSSGADSGDNSKRGINNLRPDIVMRRSSPLGIEREAARDTKASAFGFATRRTWSILTSWNCANSWLALFMIGDQLRLFYVVFSAQLFHNQLGVDIYG